MLCFARSPVVFEFNVKLTLYVHKRLKLIFIFYLFIFCEVAPPLPASSTIRHIQENGLSAPGRIPPPTLEKPKHVVAARGIQDARPSVESLLDELESSVPTPM